MFSIGKSDVLFYRRSRNLQDSMVGRIEFGQALMQRTA